MRSISTVFVAFFISFISLMPLSVQAGEGDHIDGTLFSQVETFTLKNGLEVVVIPDHRSPIVTHMVWYRVGSADEEQGKSGLAHFLEHLLFKGSDHFPGGALDQAVKRIGGSHNAFTSYDYTGYFQRVSREHLEKMMAIEADRMLQANFTAEDMAVELKVVLEERARSIETSPSSKLYALMQLALWKNHPYRRPIIGWRHEIEGLTHEDALAFYQRYYTPANAILVIAGDVSIAEVRTLAQKTYGKLENRAPRAARNRPSEPDDLHARQVITVRDPQIGRDSFRMSFRVPSFNTAKPGQSEALVLLSEILSGTSRSRIYRDLVTERQIAISAGASYSTGAKDDTDFTLYGTPKGETTLEDMERELLAAIRKVAEEGVSDEEISRARNRLFASTLYAQDSAGGLARLFGSSYVVGGTLETIRAWPERMKAVKSEDIQAVAAEFFDPESAVIGYLRKAETQDHTSKTKNPS